MTVMNLSSYSEVEQYYSVRLLDIIEDLGSKYIIWQDPIDNNVTVSTRNSTWCHRNLLFVWWAMHKHYYQVAESVATRNPDDQGLTHRRQHLLHLSWMLYQLSQILDPPRNWLNGHCKERPLKSTLCVEDHRSHDMLDSMSVGHYSTPPPVRMHEL